MGERVETSPESGHSRLAAGTAFGRGSGPSLAERREAAQRRLTSMAQTSGAVEAALARFDDRVMALGAVAGSARESVRALLGVACRLPGYDVTLAADGVRVRVRHTAAGLDVAVAAAAPTAPHGIPVPAPGTPGLPSTPPAVGSVNSWLDATAPRSPA